MTDCMIRNGLIVDGTGREPFRADVAIDNGRIVELGTTSESARREIDADGLVVSPGFIDIHTHYDAQVMWDPTMSPSPLHGVTTVFGGNCGFTLAPIDPSTVDYLTRMLSRVEGMPLESLQSGVDFSWSSFGEYLDRIEGRLAVNAGFLVGHSALRCAVMGRDAVGRAATSTELQQMKQLLKASLEAGGMGFSSTWSTTHSDSDGNPVPSRWADSEELLGLASVTGEHPGTTMEFLPGSFSDERIDLMTRMSLSAARPLNWNLLTVAADIADAVEQQLAATDYARARGAEVLALTLGDLSESRFTFHTGVVLDSIPGWAQLFLLPARERIQWLSDPARRAEMVRSAATIEKRRHRLIQWDRYRVLETFAPQNEDLSGRTIGSIAAERGSDPFDTLLDIVVADELRTSVASPIAGDDDASWRMRADVWRDSRTVLGGTDAGAHLDMLSTFTSTTGLLARGVRERQLLRLEEAVHQLTAVPARLYGLKDRGVLKAGNHADLVLFDPETVGPLPVATRYDLPSGAGRLYGEAAGIQHVLVNGVEIVNGRGFTGALPGCVIRSGRDTVSNIPKAAA
jgi:N-acyl-D-aspartate/D-glutamate deacylase